MAVLLTAALLAAAPAEAARKKHRVRPVADRYASIVIDAGTGYVYSQSNPDKRLYPASLTKMMTLYLTFDALDNGTLDKNEPIYVSRHAAAQEPSALGLEAGSRVRAQDCIMGVVTKSANDCAVALGEALGGSEGRFARMMTEKARALGMRNTNFVNASGLFRPEQYSSARDMAILARALIRNHAKYYHLFSTASFTYKGETYLNHNKLMASYRGMDGLKTGYVYASGYNLAASAVRSGTRLIGVVFGGRTAKSRNNAMAQLLDRAFLDARRAPPRDAQVAALGPEEAAGQIQPETAAVATEQGDTSEGFVEKAQPVAAEVSRQAPVQPSPAALQPRPLNTAPIAKTAALTPNGSWAIQIGAFASHAAGTQALENAKATLGKRSAGGTDFIAPLMTQRGMVYRARLSGLGRDNAAQACRILKGNCIVLSAE